jgi:predicted nucleic acid-binding protein
MRRSMYINCAVNGISVMKISIALTDVRRIYIETAPLIYYIETNPLYMGKMDAIIEAVEQSSIEAISSVIILAEVLVQPIKLGNTLLEQEYRNILLYNNGFELQPVTALIAESAAHLRARYGLRTPDALHLATAIDSGCDAFLTNDAALQRVVEITVLLLDALEPDDIK